MQSRHAFALAVLGLVLASPARAQEGTWQIVGAARYVAHYEGQTVRGTIPFALTATLAPDGRYDVVGLACSVTDPPTVLTGTWTRGSNRFLRAVVRDGIAANITGCGGSGVRVSDLHVRQRSAADQTAVTGGFSATVRYQFTSGDERETLRARVRGEYTGTRVGE